MSLSDLISDEKSHSQKYKLSDSVYPKFKNETARFCREKVDQRLCSWRAVEGPMEGGKAMSADSLIVLGRGFLLPAHFMKFTGALIYTLL